MKKKQSEINDQLKHAQTILTRMPLSGSKKVYQQSAQFPDVRVPMRQINLTNGEMTYGEIEECSDNADLSAGKRSNCDKLKDQIKDEYPMKISEAEPVNLGGE